MNEKPLHTSEQLIRGVDKDKILSADLTYLMLAPPGNFFKFFEELKDYLKTNLTLIEAKGEYEHWSCGQAHDRQNRHWKPFKNLEAFCDKRKFDSLEVINMIKEHLDRPVCCECQILTDPRIVAKARLRAVFGIDFSTCEICNDPGK